MEFNLFDSSKMNKSKHGSKIHYLQLKFWRKSTINSCSSAVDIPGRACLNYSGPVSLDVAHGENQRWLTIDETEQLVKGIFLARFSLGLAQNPVPSPLSHRDGPTEMGTCHGSVDKPVGQRKNVVPVLESSERNRYPRMPSFMFQIGGGLQGLPLVSLSLRYVFTSRGDGKIIRVPLISGCLRPCHRTRHREEKEGNSSCWFCRKDQRDSLPTSWDQSEHKEADALSPEIQVQAPYHPQGWVIIK